MRKCFFVIGCSLFLLVSNIPLSAHQEGLGSHVATAYRLKDIPAPKIDGLLDDQAWQKANPASGFTWKDFPDRPASFETVVYVVYDIHYLYIGFRCYDAEPQQIVNRINRRGNVYDSDVAAIYIDPYHDHRTGYKFVTTPGGVKDDNYRYDDSMVDFSWEGIWWAEGNIDSLGWTAEFKIPFSNFRFSDAKKQIWGINFERFIRRKRETDAWKPLGSGGGFWTRMSLLGHLVGLEDIQSGKQFEIYPYVMGGTAGNEEIKMDEQADIGLDFQYRLTNQFRASVTVNPDFAQVEADQLEINLTRFPTRFPEKRPFFIEGNNVFATPLELFYSRRIGSKGGILWGANATGKVGNNTLGFISSQTGNWDVFGLRDVRREEESALFTVLRAKRDILEKSSIGAIYAAKEMTEEISRVGGLDASIGLREDSILTGQFAQSWNFGKSGMNRAYTFNFARGTENSNVRLAAERIEPEFSANQTGYLRKEDSRGWQYAQMQLEYTPRLEKFALQRIFIGSKGRLYQNLYADQYFINWKQRNPSLQIHPEFEENLLLWSNIVWFQMNFQKTLLEKVEIAFHYAKEAELTAVFGTKEMEAFLRTDTARNLSFSLQVTSGDFYNFSQKYIGKQNRLDLNATLRPQSNIAFELTAGFALSKNPQGETDGDFLTHSLRVTYLFTRDIFLRFFTQVGWNQTYYEKTKTSRRYLISGLIGWEYSPKSHLFLAYNEDWDTSGERLQLENRVLILKLSYLWNL